MRKVKKLYIIDSRKVESSLSQIEDRPGLSRTIQKRLKVLLKKLEANKNILAHLESRISLLLLRQQ